MVINNADKKTKIKPNKTYTASVYLKCNGARDISLWLEFYPNGAKPIKTYEKRIAVSANVWTRVSITQVSPDKTYTAMLEARVYAPVSGTTLQWAGAKLEQGNLTAFGLAIDDEPPEPYEVEGDLIFYGYSLDNADQSSSQASWTNLCRRSSSKSALWAIRKRYRHKAQSYGLFYR